jgi:hypothetical protein
LGFEQVTLSEVARELGIRSQSLYAHVDALAGLRREVQLRSFQMLVVRIDEALAGLTKRAAMIAWATSVARFDAEHPGLFTARTHTVAADPELLAAVRRAEATPQALIRSFGIAEEDAVHYDRMVWSALYGFEALRQGDRFRSSIDADETLVRLITALVLDIERHARATRAAAPPAPARPTRKAARR